MVGPVTTPPVEDELRPLDPRVRTLWWLSSAVGAVGVLAVAAGATLTVGGPIAAAGWAVAAVVVVSSIVTPPLRYARWRYAVRADDIWIREGVLWVTTTVVPFSRLQFVDTRQGPLDRALGLASLQLYTAALGAQTTIPGLAVAEAERLRERLADVDPDVIST